MKTNALAKEAQIYLDSAIPLQTSIEERKQIKLAFMSGAGVMLRLLTAPPKAPGLQQGIMEALGRHIALGVEVDAFMVQYLKTGIVP